MISFYKYLTELDDLITNAAIQAPSVSPGVALFKQKLQDIQTPPNYSSMMKNKVENLQSGTIPPVKPSTVFKPIVSEFGKNQTPIDPRKVGWIGIRG